MDKSGHLPFKDRRDAGRRLAERLTHLRGDQPIVLALPRGGVPVAFEVAQALAAQLDILLVRKIGAPHHEELGLGAVVDGAEPQVVLSDEVMAMVRPPAGYVEAETGRQLAEIERRRRVYRGDRPAPEVKDRTVIVVDDGIATGGTVRAALTALKRLGPKRVVLAVPVAPPGAMEKFKDLVDETVCLVMPGDFQAVGQFYIDFHQITDEAVVGLLAEAWGAPIKTG